MVQAQGSWTTFQVVVACYSLHYRQ